jgi:hypothetical protein
MGSERRIMTRIKVKIENGYADGFELVHEVELDAPPVGIDFEVELPDWFQNVVWPHTGTSTGRENVDACYLATIVEAPGRDELVGEWFEWA